MCYYDRYEHACGCWKWGNFRAHCQKEYRIGETCGMKLSTGQAFHTGERCANCDKRDRKVRRIEKVQGDLHRWYGDPSRAATYEKAYDELKNLLDEVRIIESDIMRRRQTLGRVEK